jgi:adenylate cyclase
MQMLSSYTLKSWHISFCILCCFFLLQIDSTRSTPSPARVFIGRDLLFEFNKLLFDFRVRSRPVRNLSGKVGILAIDEKSISKFGRWPFPRRVYVNAFQNLKEMGVKWVGFDVLFSEPESPMFIDTIPDIEDAINDSINSSRVLDVEKFSKRIGNILEKSTSDSVFAKTIKDFQNVVQAMAFLPPLEGQASLKNWEHAKQQLAPLVRAYSNQVDLPDKNIPQHFPLLNTDLILGEKPILGFINNEPDTDGLMRRLRMFEEIRIADSSNSQQSIGYLPSMTLLLAASYLGCQIDVSQKLDSFQVTLCRANSEYEIPLSNKDILINHYGGVSSGADVISNITISLADAADNIFPEKIPEVLILGSTILGADDRRPSPLDPYANGVEHHLAVVENIVQKDFLKIPENAIAFELMLLGITGGIFSIVSMYLNAVRLGVFILMQFTLIEIIDRFWIFGQGWILDVGTVYAENALAFFGVVLFKYFYEERESRKIKGAFQHYLSPEVIDQVLKSDEGLMLGGVQKELTVLFSDIRDFTSISEKLPPDKLARLLNYYFTPMTELVLRSHGVLDKYIGDALMAFWGAPFVVADHADQCINVAIEMQERMEPLRRYFVENNLPTFEIGIGINSGMMIMGNLGSDLRFDYTVVGDSVNLGSRLESVTKFYGVKIICSEFTIHRLQRPSAIVFRELDSIRVKGKRESVRIFEVMGRSSGETIKMIEQKTTFENALHLYRSRSFAEAIKVLNEFHVAFPGDEPSVILMNRCRYFELNPPADDWDGEWNFDAK